MRMPPPPPPTMPKEPETPTISTQISRFDLEAAVWIHGGYPQTPWAKAVKTLLRKCRDAGFDQISPVSLWQLDKALPANVDLTFKGYDF